MYKEGIIIFAISFVIMLIWKRKWVMHYLKDYKGEMMKAWKGELKGPSHLETVIVDKNGLKKGAFILICILISAASWKVFSWFSILLFIVFYFVGGLILINMEVIK